VRTKAWRHITAIILIIVTTMLTVPTPRDHFTARVTMVTQEMVLFVQVKKYMCVKYAFFHKGKKRSQKIFTCYIKLCFWLTSFRNVTIFRNIPEQLIHPYLLKRLFCLWNNPTDSWVFFSYVLETIFLFSCTRTGEDTPPKSWLLV